MLTLDFKTIFMEIQGKWSKDDEGYMEFETTQLQRLYEAVIDQYYQVYNQYLDELNDEEVASDMARKEGYSMITDYKTIEEEQEFATTYTTPSYTMDIWYEWDPISKKRIYEKGTLRIRSK